MWTVICQFAALFAIRGRLKIKVKFGQLFCEYCYFQFIRTNSFMWTFIRCSQKCYQYDLSIPVMEGIVFVYIFRAISFVGHLNEYSQFGCLLQLIRCFLFANVNESLQAGQEVSLSPARTLSIYWHTTIPLPKSHFSNNIEFLSYFFSLPLHPSSLTCSLPSADIDISICNLLGILVC